MGKKAKAAGSFLGGIANNPGVIVLGLALGAILIFKGDIQKAFGSLGEGLVNIELPSLPDITLPDITFPDFPSFPDFGGIFAGFQTQLDDIKSSIAGQTVEVPGGTVTIPPDTVVNPDGTVTSTTPPTIDLGLNGGDLSTLFGELRPKVFDTLVNIGLSPKDAATALRDVTTIEGLNQVLQSFNVILGGGVPITPEPFTQPQIEDPSLPPGFFGGGSGFIGGSIFQTPIANLSLSQIIDMFNVSASQAANILAIAKDDFGGFDFGTNTGSGIGSIFPNIPELSGLGGNVSNPNFQGLTATEIANLLTGGNIQNF